MEHIRNDHPEITNNHKSIISDIISAPFGVSYREKDGSIGFFKEFETGEQYYLELSVRKSSIGEFFVRTLHHIESERIEKRVKKRIIITIDKSKII